jgi:hypothetical protein
MGDSLSDPNPDRDTGVGTHPRPELGPAPSMPRWVKVFGIALLVLVVLFAIMIASGHGPGRHMPGMAGPGGHASPVSAAQNGAPHS